MGPNRIKSVARLDLTNLGHLGVRRFRQPQVTEGVHEDLMELPAMASLVSNETQTIPIPWSKDVQSMPVLLQLQLLFPSCHRLDVFDPSSKSERKLLGQG